MLFRRSEASRGSVKRQVQERLRTIGVGYITLAIALDGLLAILVSAQAREPREVLEACPLCPRATCHAGAGHRRGAPSITDNMPSRRRLPTCRPNESHDLAVDGITLVATGGYDDAGRPAKMFVNGGKVGSAIGGLI